MTPPLPGPTPTYSFACFDCDVSDDIPMTGPAFGGDQVRHAYELHDEISPHCRTIDGLSIYMTAIRRLER